MRQDPQIYNKHRQHPLSLCGATATFEPAIKRLDTSTESGIADNDEEFPEKYANQLDVYDNDDDEILARYANELDA